MSLFLSPVLPGSGSKGVISARNIKAPLKVNYKAKVRLMNGNLQTD